MKLKLQGLKFMCPSPSSLHLESPTIMIRYTGSRWELWGRDTQSGTAMLCHTSHSRDTLVGIVAWARGLRKTLPEGYIDGARSKRT
jgi:hypothetical protein